MKMKLSDKYMLTVREAAAYFGIGIKKLRRLAQENTDTFGVRSGNRYMIIRTKFEEYLRDNSTV